MRQLPTTQGLQQRAVRGREGGPETRAEHSPLVHWQRPAALTAGPPQQVQKGRGSDQASAKMRGHAATLAYCPCVTAACSLLQQCSSGQLQHQHSLTSFPQSGTGPHPWTAPRCQQPPSQHTNPATCGHSRALSRRPLAAGMGWSQLRVWTAAWGMQDCACGRSQCASTFRTLAQHPPHNGRGTADCITARQPAQPAHLVFSGSVDEQP